jgi:glyoxylase-like metal-dependent hydrolase (beta-lactamase superfamily II)
MHANRKKSTTYLLLIIVLANLYACNSNKTSQTDNTPSLVDSLIQIHRIDEKTILVSFGVDAITAINTDKGIVVIDAGISTGLTKTCRKRIENEFNCSHFAYVINTHAHHDHNRGNSVFSEADVVGQENGSKEIEDQWKNTEKMKTSLGKVVKEYDDRLQISTPHSEEWYDNFKQKIRYQNAYHDALDRIPIKKPTISFPDSLVINMGDITFEMRYFGKCHSNSDILIYIPELKMLFTGDLMFSYGRPSIRDKTMAEREIWRKSLVWTEERMNNIETVIGGHGEFLTMDDLKAFVGIVYDKTK